MDSLSTAGGHLGAMSQQVAQDPGQIIVNTGFDSAWEVNHRLTVVNPPSEAVMVLAGQGSSPCRCFHALGACMTLHLPFGNRHGSAGHRQKDETHARRPRNRPHSFLAKQGRATERCWQMQVQLAVGDVSFAFSFTL
ncbi:hypothetical protein C0Q70_13330 [Pomacea canaliculata]|uniref:Uncharacterized protein n=1 Tax=Pomacea canaliculata TaxID=400727 RepID=A0A2T7NWW9_POMCA|nr:hypothetical protein C0Q70_13330 [Pomacea canaliculata]